MKLQKSTVIVGIVILMLSMLYSTWISHRQGTIYTVDLGKITRAQMLFAGRLAQGAPSSKKLWMTTISETSSRVQKTIAKIAGRHTVIVTPAVVQGGIDITNKVLTQLGLPTRVPRLRIPQSALMPNAISNTAGKIQPTTKKAAAWTLP